MQGTVNALTATLTESAIWGEFTILAPFVASMVLVSIGFYLLKRVLRKTSKLKGGV